MDLFYIDPGVARPFVVVSRAMDGTVSGVVFIDPNLDGNTAWARNLFYAPSATEKFEYWVTGIRQGTAPGEWEPEPHPAAVTYREGTFKAAKPIPLAGARR